ncbi:hypothetical protein [Mongoliibacter ruber]|uniref:Uncharacterized protein n=1 Tax=Mongoliibacter ruber TaxID=1750599 RepID=A0A2T0WVK1_9BACT|nr:hypothetical protein [Mongoliibacter ruber]PRY90722.1 hypothetical protein CLW00_101387 [Mongoliibacter ruber]
MYTIFPFVLTIVIFIIFLVYYRNQKGKLFFLEENVKRLKMEKKVKEMEISDSLSMIDKLEEDLFESRKIQLDLMGKNNFLADENEALRKVVSELKKIKEEKSDDVIVEYIFKK